MASSDCASGPGKLPLYQPGPAYPEHARSTACYAGLFRDRLRPRRRAGELAWAAKIHEMLLAPALRSYASAGLKRAADFDLRKTAALWLELLKS